MTELQDNAEVAEEADHKAEIGAYTGADKDALKLKIKMTDDAVAVENSKSRRRARSSNQIRIYTIIFIQDRNFHINITCTICRHTFNNTNINFNTKYFSYILMNQVPIP